MKKEAVEKTKMRRLAKRLRLELWGAVGILESLWLWARKNAPRGDIGIFTNDEIAEGIGWEKRKPEELIQALVESKWVDSAPDPHRLAIHDLQDHADNTWRQHLVDNNLTFWNGLSPRRETPGRPKLNLQSNSRKTPDGLNLNSALLTRARALPEPEPEPEPLDADMAERQSTHERYHEFVAQWPNATDVDPGAQIWVQLVDSGEITPTNWPDIIAGLERAKASRNWARGYKPGIAKWLIKRGWKDNPEPAEAKGDW